MDGIHLHDSVTVLAAVMLFFRILVRLLSDDFLPLLILKFVLSRAVLSLRVLPRSLGPCCVLRFCTGPVC